MSKDSARYIKKRKKEKKKKKSNCSVFVGCGIKVLGFIGNGCTLD